MDDLDDLKRRGCCQFVASELTHWVAWLSGSRVLGLAQQAPGGRAATGAGLHAVGYKSR
jgi:hypothetical protein